MREAWQANIPRMWQERKVAIPEGAKPEDLIKVPQNAQYFAALGAIEFGKSEDDCVGRYAGYEQLEYYIEFGRQEEKAKSGGEGSGRRHEGELDSFRRSLPAEEIYARDIPARGRPSPDSSASMEVRLPPRPFCWMRRGDILCKAYQLSNGNPIQDTIEMFEKLRGQVEAQNAKLEVLGVATTGYAKDILKDVLHADVALVETVAHTESALQFYEDPHVIVDVGGQDIKIIVLQNGRVKDFKLNTQCSAGNGYFLQSTAEGFGIDGGTVCRSCVFGADHAGVWLRLRGLHAIGHREFPAAGLARGGDSRRVWPLCCPRTYSCTSPAFPIWLRWARASYCKAGRRTTWRW